MNALLDRKLRFGDAAHAIDSTPRALRKWLQSGIALPSDDSASGGWREFSLADIACLAVMRRAVDFGVSIKAANQLGFFVLNQFPEIFAAPDDVAIGLPGMWTNRPVHVWFGNGDLHARVQVDDDELPPSDVYLTLNIEPILRRAFARAIGEEAADGA